MMWFHDPVSASFRVFEELIAFEICVESIEWKYRGCGRTKRGKNLFHGYDSNVKMCVRDSMNEYDFVII